MRSPLPFCFIANTCASLPGSHSLTVSLVFALLNCIEASLIASLLVCFARAMPGLTGMRVPISFQRVPDVLAFWGIVALEVRSRSYWRRSA